MNCSVKTRRASVHGQRDQRREEWRQVRPRLHEGCFSPLPGAWRGEGGEPAQTGTKAAAHYDLKIPAGKNATVRMRLTKAGDEKVSSFDDFSSTMDLRRKEAEDFYRGVCAAACLRRRKAGDATGVCRDAVVQAVLSLRSRALALATRCVDGSGRQCAQLGMVSHADEGCDFNAGQVGVPMVCGVGPRVSHAAALYGRSRRLRRTS